MDLKQTIDALKKLQKNIDEVAEGFLSATINNAKKEVVKEAKNRIEEDTKYTKSIRQWVRPRKNSISGRLYITHPAALYIEYGTGVVGTGKYAPKEMLRPKVAKAMHWVSKEGEHIFRTEVAGQPAKYIWTTAKQKYLVIFQQDCQKFVAKLGLQGINLRKDTFKFTSSLKEE